MLQLGRDVPPYCRNSRYVTRWEGEREGRLPLPVGVPRGSLAPTAAPTAAPAPAASTPASTAAATRRLHHQPIIKAVAPIPLAILVHAVHQVAVRVGARIQQLDDLRVVKGRRADPVDGVPEDQAIQPVF